MNTIWRSEKNMLAAYRMPGGHCIYVQALQLNQLGQWLETGESNPLVQRLIDDFGLPENPSQEERLHYITLIEATRTVSPPQRSMTAPEVINLELTTRCPLRCPQCYCTLENGRDLNPETAEKALEEAAAMKVPNINLSGGETLAYPHLDRLLRKIRALGMISSIAISGWGFDRERLRQLKAAGVDDVYVSLNGSTEAVNRLSREGYHEAMNALRLLQEDGETKAYINWVAREDNIADFPDLVKLAEAHDMDGVVILETKPDATMSIQAPIKKESLLQLAAYLKECRRQKDSMPVLVEPCFSPLRAELGKSFFFNHNQGIHRGCGAGRNGAALDVDGNWTPCRHVMTPEPYPSLQAYWLHSPILKGLREHEENRDASCEACELKANCLPCRAAGHGYQCSLV
ncbi:MULTISPECIES: radical SAM protein [Anoxynatronum]|uniref:Pyrroloquinoline quinone biosynthesis protein E n=2 Tax=Anoxynatronum TaxID=210622 RepID=A0AA45WWH5_9CLOT|nr:radical SAM protein [Anoxynatronum buryatiense]SMP57959.1 pyrroloquinoline quinone biosynthesis protein E [Anoxynatronum buryatiense]